MSQTKFVLVNETDNVLICCQTVEIGEEVMINKQKYKMLTGIDVGHKIAKASLTKGSKVIRYGVPIGSTTADVNIGEHIHLHNMKSDYIPSHTRQAKVGE